MIRRRINQGGVKGKRFQVSDVPDLSTSKGVAKENDEMRKLAMDLTSFSEEIQGKIDDVKALIPPPTTTVPTTTTGGGTPIKPPDSKFPVLEVWQDGTAIVIGTRVWDFHESSTVRFEVTDLGSQRARIRAHTKRSLNTMWGTFYGGYALEVPATPGGQISHPAYVGKNSISQPFTVQKDRSLIHWVGDTMSVEPAFEAALSPSATSGMGFNAERPKNELAAWTAYTQGIIVSGSSYDVTTVKYRVTPNLQIFDPDEFYRTTPHVTRIFLKDSPTIRPHVRVDDPVIVTTGNTSIVDPRTYTASMWFDLVASGVNYSIENLGASGTNIGEVYSYQDVDTFYLRRLRASGTLSLQQDQNYITLIGSGYRYAAEQHSPGFRILMYDVPIGTNPETFWFRGIVPHGSIAMWISADDALNISGTNTEYSIQAEDGPEGAYLQLSGTNGVIDQVQFVGVSGTTVSWGDYDTIYISSEKNTTSSVDNCTSGVGSGEIYHESETLSGHTTYYLRKLLAGSGISITTQMHDVVVTSTVSGVSYDYLAVSSGTGVFLRLLDSLGVADDVQIVGSGGTTVSYIDDHTISISSEQQDSYTYGVLNCTSGTGEGYVFGTQTVSGTHTDFSLRTIKAGQNIAVTTSGCDIVIDSTVSGVVNTYDMINCASGTGTGSIYADSIVDGANTTFVLRKILAASGISIETSGCDIVIGSAVSGTKYNMYAVPTDTDALIRLHGSDNSDDDVKIVGSGSVDVEYVDERTIRISAQDTNNTYEVVNCVSGTGTGLVHAYTDYIDNHANIYLRKIKAGQGIGVTTSGCDIIVAATSSGVAGVSGMNLDDCTSLSTDTQFGWYIDYDDNIEPNTRTLRFRTFGVQQDLYLSQCGNDYIFTVLVSGIDNRNTLYPSIGVFQKNVQNGGAFTKELYFRGLRPGSGISLYLDESDNKSDIVISSTSSGINTDLLNCGSGVPIVASGIISDNVKTYNIRTFKGEPDWIDVTYSGCEVNIGLSKKPMYYDVEMACSGNGLHGPGFSTMVSLPDPTGYQPSGYANIFTTTSGSGIESDPVSFRYRGLVAGNNIQLWQNDCSILIETSDPNFYDIENVASGYNACYGPTVGLYFNSENKFNGFPYTEFQLRTLQPFRYQNGVATNLTVSGTVIQPRTTNYNYATSQDNVYFIDRSTGQKTIIVQAMNSFIPYFLSFDRINIPENGHPKLADNSTCYTPEFKLDYEFGVVPNTYTRSDVHIYRGTITDPDWYFMVKGLMVDFKQDVVVQVTVRVLIQTQDVTNAQSNFVRYPQIMLYKNGLYYRTLDVDMRISEYNELRQILQRQNITVPADGATKVWLQGTALIPVAEDNDRIRVAYRHETGNQITHRILEGSIDIHQVGLTVQGEVRPVGGPGLGGVSINYSTPTLERRFE